jgi:hypothetical protein
VAHLQPEDETFADWRHAKARRTVRLGTLFAEVTELWVDSKRGVNLFGFVERLRFERR